MHIFTEEGSLGLNLSCDALGYSGGGVQTIPLVKQRQRNLQNVWNSPVSHIVHLPEQISVHTRGSQDSASLTHYLPFFFFFRSHTTDNVSFLKAILWWLITTNVLIKLMSSSVSYGKVPQKCRIKPPRDDTTQLSVPYEGYTHMYWLRCVLFDVEMVFSTWWCFCYLGCQDFKNTELGKNYSLHGYKSAFCQRKTTLTEQID